MNKIFKSRKILLYIYILMLTVCVILNCFGKDIEIVSIIINAFLFIIVGVIFILSNKKLSIVSDITSELKDATNNIQKTYIEYKFLLWDFYKNNHEKSIFLHGYLNEPYNNYKNEMNRIENEKSIGFQCDIENYINQSLIEDYLKKNIISLIPSTMTGLGILGTFIGLSLGLQNFNTGNTDEIINSIPILMNGIKIAFHTSIFGMVFSLVFNFVYKNILEESLEALDIFLDEFRGKVCPDSKNENDRLIYQLAEKQANAIIYSEAKLENELVGAIKDVGLILRELKSSQDKQNELLLLLPSKISTEVSEGITKSLAPQFESFGVSLEDFASKVSERQTKSMTTIVNKFIQSLNEAVGNNFEHLGSIIEETCSMQELSNTNMKDILDRTNNMAINIKDINDMSLKTLSEFEKYIDLIEKLQNVINENFMNVNIQLDANNQITEKMISYTDNLIDYEKKISESTNNLSNFMAEQVNILKETTNELSNNNNKGLKVIVEKADEYNTELAKVTEKHIKKIEALCKDISLKLEESLNNIFENASSSNETIKDSAQIQLQKLNEISSNIGSEINLASIALAKSATNLNGNLEKSLNGVLVQFDNELSEISTQLGKTLIDIDDRTNQVPSVVASAYDAMYKTFEDYTNTTNNLINEMKVILKEVSKK